MNRRSVESRAAQVAELLFDSLLNLRTQKGLPANAGEDPRGDRNSLSFPGFSMYRDLNHSPQQDVTPATDHASLAPAAQHDACLKLLSSLSDETDPLLVRLVDRARRNDGLFPTCADLSVGPLASCGDARDLFIQGNARDEDFTRALNACNGLRSHGSSAQRELAALSLALLEASSIVHRRRLLVSSCVREADARLAAAASGLNDAWQELVVRAMHTTLARCA